MGGEQWPLEGGRLAQCRKRYLMTILVQMSSGVTTSCNCALDMSLHMTPPFLSLIQLPHPTSPRHSHLLAQYRKKTRTSRHNKDTKWICLSCLHLHDVVVSEAKIRWTLLSLVGIQFAEKCLHLRSYILCVCLINFFIILMVLKWLWPTHIILSDSNNWVLRSKMKCNKTKWVSPEGPKENGSTSWEPQASLIPTVLVFYSFCMYFVSMCV